MEQTECSEKSAYKIQTPGNYPEGSIQTCIMFAAFVSAQLLEFSHVIKPETAEDY